MTYDHKTKGALAASKAFHATGASSRQRAMEKTIALLWWVYRWRWTTPDLVPQIVGAKNMGFAASLVKKGLLHAVKTHAGTSDGNPSKLLFLTRAGHRFLLDVFNEPATPYVLGNRYNAKTMSHDRRVQLEVLRWLSEAPQDGSEGRDYITPHEYRYELPAGVLGRKKPDALLVVSKRGERDKRIALEVELTPKNQDLRRTMLRQVVSMLDEGEVTRVIILVPSEGSVKTYKSTYAANAHWWYVDDLGITQHRYLSPAHAEAVTVQVLGQHLKLKPERTDVRQLLR